MSAQERINADTEEDLRQQGAINNLNRAVFGDDRNYAEYINTRSMTRLTAYHQMADLRRMAADIIPRAEVRVPFMAVPSYTMEDIKEYLRKLTPEQQREISDHINTLQASQE